jgi:hypothetical protein
LQQQQEATKRDGIRAMKADAPLSEIKAEFAERQKQIQQLVANYSELGKKKGREREEKNENNIFFNNFVTVTDAELIGDNISKGEFSKDLTTLRTIEVDRIDVRNKRNKKERKKEERKNMFYSSFSSLFLSDN